MMIMNISLIIITTIVIVIITIITIIIIIIIIVNSFSGADSNVGSSSAHMLPNCQPLRLEGPMRTGISYV